MRKGWAAVAKGRVRVATTGEDETTGAGGRGTRLARLDGLRGAAAAGVVVHHLFYHMAAWRGAPPVVAMLTDWLWHWGWTLVDLFFVLSGYVFAHVYLGAAPMPRGRRWQADFWVARLARLYPLHLATLTGFAIFAWRDPVNTPFAFAGHVLMMQGFVSPVAQTFDNASWSLTMEVVCYALFAAGCALGEGVLRRGTVLLVWLAASWLLLTGLPGGPWTTDCLPRGIMGFFLGQLLWRQRGALARVPGWVLGVAILGGFMLQSGAYSPLLPLGLVVWPAVLLLALRLPVMESGVMLWLGERSYAIYLLNMAVIRAVDAWVPVARLAGWQQAGLMVGSAAAVLALGELAGRGLETPARRAIRGVFARRARVRGVDGGDYAGFHKPV